MANNESPPNDPGTPWKWTELLFGGGIIAYLVGATISGIWWAASIDTKTANIGDNVAAIERRFDGLDNVVLGNRITKVEVEVQAFATQQDRVERKIDRLLDRRYGSGGPQQPTSGQEP